jgi:ubiquinone/menaquinone biosynthesis C-methylase UbiE
MRAQELEEMYNLEESYWWFVGRRRLVADLIRRYAGPWPRILDVGCGSGGTLVAVQELGEVVGCDLSEDALGLCRRRDLGGLVASRAEALSFTAESFDVVLACDVLEHVEHDAQGLAEIRRVLRPGGILILTVPAYPWLWSSHDEILGHFRRYTRRALAARLREADFRPQLLTYAVGLVLPAILAVRGAERLRHKATRPGQTGLIELPTPANRALIGVLNLERRLIPRTGLPWGSSLVAVARKD